MKVFCYTVISFIGSIFLVQGTIIIVEDAKACFRRVLAGKRITRGFVRRALNCETVEECQKECGEEKLFTCEGFNYRLDPSGRGKGDCELLSVPLSRIDVYRDSYEDPDYDYYERDRNAASVNCRKRPPYRPYQGGGNYHGHGYGERDQYFHDSRNGWSDRRHDYEERRPTVTYHGTLDYRQSDHWRDEEYRRKPEIDRRYDYGPNENNRRRGDNSYHDRERPHDFDRKPIEKYPQHGYEYHKPWVNDNHRYGETYYSQSKNYYLPPSNDAPSNSVDWGLYHKFKNNYSQWNEDKYGENYAPKRGYLPPDFHLEPPRVGSYLPDRKPYDGGNGAPITPSALLPVEHRRPTHNYIQDDCSLRSVTGFKLNKRVVKKYFAVPNIYECELLCFKENQFICSSYAYRYTIVSEPTDNCYLSNLDYKELDHYTDLEPDRDFDVYTMNNRYRCEKPIIGRKENSDCFWRVRSGERLNNKIVRDSLIAKSIVECQLECLTSKKFTCRAFSYRYGSPVIGGPIDNCQLTDWPYYELDPLNHFTSESGFEIYERGSFGHGCETGHFGIKGHVDTNKKQIKTNQLCYIGFGTPARLLSQAVKKSLRVFSDSECKEECSKARSETLFQCMSFSFWSKGQRNVPNCYLSDIYQRDLVPKLDYVYDPNSLLFAWDNYNPDCLPLGTDPLHTNRISTGPPYQDYFPHALDTWSVYSVNGWPCRRGARCKENSKAGFWFCEIEGGESGAWDYCCRPDHQCGASNGYPYLWCYVGPERTQWRKCNDRYYPYIHDRLDDDKYLPPIEHPKPWRPALFRPDRLPGQAPPPQSHPSLDQYEMIFDEEFLDPPKPGGFGQPRHWPVSYLHKEMPPNDTDSSIQSEDSKYAAIQSLIDVIKNNDLKNLEYHITTEPNKKDDVLFVKIPLPSNFTVDNQNTWNNQSLEPTDEGGRDINSRRFQKSLPSFDIEDDNELNTKLFQRLSLTERKTTTKQSLTTQRAPEEFRKPNPIYRRGFVIRTNVTTRGVHA
ncbi:uncharacterized protein LOC130901158 [Diorhabda carinulata]|uniref:uncharacterized protein LOC130901158 n=1 Tax=Diorhabda carinulata TaxID=1163345 RepID=UPI0025A2E62D|nr:uncharacterized protein LOC130901158 [Diorhabda carinulata]